MGSDKLFSDEYLNYLESLPADEREDTLNAHINHYQLDRDGYELYSILNNRDFDKLTGKID